MMKFDIKAKFKSWFRRDNLLLSLLSLVIAIVLWIAIISYLNPDTSIVIENVPVQINTSSQDAGSLSIVSGKVESVDVTVSVPRNQVPSIDVDSLLAEIDLTGETKAGTYQKSIGVSSQSDFVKILSVSPSETSIVLDVTVSKTLSISVDDGGYSAPEGYYLGVPTLSKDTVTIVGPKAIVDRVKAAVSYIDIPAESVGIIDFKENDIFLLDEKGMPIDKEALAMDVSNLTVSVPIIRTKIVPLEVELQNAPSFSDGFYQMSYSVDGKIIDDIVKIEIAAIDDIYDEISSITLGTLDFNKISTKKYTEEFTVEMPTGVTNISGISSVTVTVSFSSMATDTITILPENISFLSPPVGKNASITSKSVRVNICGSAAAVKEAKKAGLKGTVSLSGASTGGIREYPLTVSFGDIKNVWVYLPEGVTAPSVNIELK